MDELHVTFSQLAAYKDYLDARFARLAERMQKLEELERKTAQLACQVNQRLSNDRLIDEYDIVTHTNGGVRWIWKHFMRGTRSALSFATQEEAVQDARRDAALHLKMLRPSNAKSVGRAGSTQQTSRV
jgi:hypothetical protein